MIDVITRINVSDFDLNLVTASISPSIQDVRELHALSPPLAARYALDTIYIVAILRQPDVEEHVKHVNASYT